MTKQESAYQKRLTGLSFDKIGFDLEISHKTARDYYLKQREIIEKKCRRCSQTIPACEESEKVSRETV